MTIDIGWVDIALALFLAVSVLVGLVRGVVFELLSLAGWFVAYLAGRLLTPSFETYLHIGNPGSALNHIVTFACVFVITLALWALGARLIRNLIRATPLSPIDRVLGAGFGLLRGVVVLVVVAVVVSVSPLQRSPAWQRSQGAVWLQALLQELRPLLPAPDSHDRSA
jgi:membrane protein required for colicin V production